MVHEGVAAITQCRWAATGYRDHTVHIWEALAAKCGMEHEHVVTAVNSVRYHTSPDGLCYTPRGLNRLWMHDRREIFRHATCVGCRLQSGRAYRTAARTGPLSLGDRQRQEVARLIRQ
jgi:hypothetical protein